MAQAKKTQTDKLVVRRVSRSGRPPSAVGGGLIEPLQVAGFSNAEIHKIVVSKRSLERREHKGEPLSMTENDRAMRVLRIFDHAKRVLGSSEKAHRWLRKPCRALDGAVPLDLMVSETGAHCVDMELHAIDHGIFA